MSCEIFYLITEKAYFHIWIGVSYTFLKCICSQGEGLHQSRLLVRLPPLLTKPSVLPGMFAGTITSGRKISTCPTAGDRKWAFRRESKPKILDLVLASLSTALTRALCYRNKNSPHFDFSRFKITFAPTTLHSRHTNFNDFVSVELYPRH